MCFKMKFQCDHVYIVTIFLSQYIRNVTIKINLIHMVIHIESISYKSMQFIMCCVFTSQPKMHNQF